jgi:RNA polymerase sigma factor (sigma-70 family)
MQPQTNSNSNSKHSRQTEADRDRDQKLVERVIAGDQDAFTEIYRAYFQRVFAPSFEGRSSLLTWTFGIAHNVCSRHFRHCSRWMVGSKNARELDDRPVESTIERRVDAARVLERCGQVLVANRRVAHQEIFHLRYGQSHSIRAIAEKVGKSNEAVKVSLRRSRMALSDNIAELAVVLENVAESA